MSLKFLALFAAVAAQLAAAQAPSASPSSAPCNAKADLSANRAAYSAPNDIFQNYPAPSIAPVPANVNQRYGFRSCLLSGGYSLVLTHEACCLFFFFFLSLLLCLQLHVHLLVLEL
jgi:hypothetical protein